MTFFHDLNKKLADLAKKQDLNESAQPVAERSTGDYSAKKAAAGKDIGKPGKMFSKIAKSAGKAYGSKESGEKVAGAVLAKLRAKESVEEADDHKETKLIRDLRAQGLSDKEIVRKMEQIKRGTTKTVAKEGEMDESALQAYLGKKKYGETGMKALQQAGRDGASKQKMAQIRAKHDKMDEQMADEGNAFTAALKATPKGGKFKVGGKEFTDTSSIEEKKETKKSRTAGTAFDPEVAKSMFATKDEHPRYDVKDTGYSKRYTRKAEPESEKDDAEVSDAPKKKGRPKGPAKGPERTTKGAWKHKGARKEKTEEDLDTDGVMMTRPSNMSSESINSVALTDKGEYDQEGDMARDQLHTLVKASKELHGILADDDNLPEWVQSKITKALDYIKSANDYMDQEKHDRDEPIAEKAVSVAQRRAAGIAHAAQKGEIPKGKLRGASKEMAKMPKGELKKFAKTKETGLPKKADEGKGDGNLANNAKPYDKVTQGDVVAGRLGKDEMGGKKKKEKAVDETTVAGSVATSPTGGKSKGGMQFGKGVYESLDQKFKQALTEGMNVSVNMNTGPDGNPSKNITVSADGEDAEALAMLLKMAGISGGQKEETCPACGSADCGCESIDENSPDWPTNTEKIDADPNLRTYSGGLNGPKSTGQTTVPVVASQERRLHSESVDLERNLFRLYQNYKSQ
jgi:hypothetical protein